MQHTFSSSINVFIPSYPKDLNYDIVYETMRVSLYGHHVTPTTIVSNSFIDVVIDDRYSKPAHPS